MGLCFQGGCYDVTHVFVRILDLGMGSRRAGAFPRLCPTAPRRASQIVGEQLNSTGCRSVARSRRYGWCCKASIEGPNVLNCCRSLDDVFRKAEWRQGPRCKAESTPTDHSLTQPETPHPDLWHGSPSGLRRPRRQRSTLPCFPDGLPLSGRVDPCAARASEDPSQCCGKDHRAESTAFQSASSPKLHIP